MQNYIIPDSISHYQPKPSMLDFNDLDFQPHRGADDAVQARLDFGNGLSISVVAGKDLSLIHISEPTRPY